MDCKSYHFHIFCLIYACEQAVRSIMYGTIGLSLPHLGGDMNTAKEVQVDVMFGLAL